jgi:hypothetical protein
LDAEEGGQVEEDDLVEDLEMVEVVGEVEMALENMRFFSETV